MESGGEVIEVEGGYPIVVICTSGYEESGTRSPCFICGHEYDMGIGYSFAPCPRCGHDPEDWPIYRVIYGVSRRLKTSQGKVRTKLAQKMGVSDKTLKKWQYCIEEKRVEEIITSFRKAVRELLEENGL